MVLTFSADRTAKACHKNTIYCLATLKANYCVRDSSLITPVLLWLRSRGYLGSSRCSDLRAWLDIAEISMVFEFCYLLQSWHCCCCSWYWCCASKYLVARVKKFLNTFYWLLVCLVITLFQLLFHMRRVSSLPAWTSSAKSRRLSQYWVRYEFCTFRHNVPDSRSVEFCACEMALSLNLRIRRGGVRGCKCLPVSKLQELLLAMGALHITVIIYEFQSRVALVA